jgi:glycosyltransferase involved in cell wall biosynthesis
MPELWRDSMLNIIVFHHTLFDLVTGSAEKLLRDVAWMLAESDSFVVNMVYSRKNAIHIPEDFREHENIRLHEFDFERFEDKPPYRYLNMKPNILNIIANTKATGFLGLVWGDNQDLIKRLPKGLPTILFSPFGNFTSNGNVRKLYVSGASNVDRLKSKGILFAEVLFNPLRIPTLNDEKAHGRPLSRPIVLGRTGRDDPHIFDPISIEAFSKLEKKYGSGVQYRYVNPSNEARELASKLGLKQIRFYNWLNPDELKDFYNQIDIFAHARRDGETLGVAIGEAMLYQNVVVTHVSKLYNDHLLLINEPHGKVVGCNDVQGYFEALDSFVKQRQILPQLGLEARKFASSLFDINMVASRIVEDCIDSCEYYGKPYGRSLRTRFFWFRFSSTTKYSIKILFKRILFIIMPNLDVSELRRGRIARWIKSR